MKNKKKQTFKPGFKGFQFQIYWIYIIIFIFFLALNFMGTEISKPTNWQEFNSQMLQPQKVDKIAIFTFDISIDNNYEEFIRKLHDSDVEVDIFGPRSRKLNGGKIYKLDINKISGGSGRAIYMYRKKSKI